MQRETLQRKIIISSIHTLGHARTSEVISYLKENYPSLSVATVYRNLNTLCEDGFIRKVSTNLNEDIFEDASKNLHDHFICSKCGIIYDIENEKDSTSYYDKDGNLVTNKSITYYGVCKDCINRIKN
ncbi:MAG: transcriptional repressor [Bacilli bacterium]|jgi:Fur family transcriptional regulator, peroxide stress response regulator